jgi:hypothetical protein
VLEADDPVGKDDNEEGHGCGGVLAHRDADEAVDEVQAPEAKRTVDSIRAQSRPAPVLAAIQSQRPPVASPRPNATDSAAPTPMMDTARRIAVGRRDFGTGPAGSAGDSGSCQSGALTMENLPRASILRDEPRP